MPTVKRIPHLKQTIFNSLESSFLRITLNIKYDINEEIEEKIKRKIDINVNMFIQIYSPLSLIGRNVLKWSKYNRIATEKISTNVSRKTNLRFRML